MRNRYLVGAIAVVAAIASAWFALEQRGAELARTTNDGLRAASDDIRQRAAAYPSDPAEFAEWWRAADAAKRATAIAALRLPEARERVLALADSSKCLEWRDSELFGQLGPVALDALKALVRRIDEDSYRKECAFEIVVSILAGEQRVQFLESCLRQRDVIVQRQVASWIGSMAFEDSFQPSDSLRRELARAIDLNSELTGDWVEANSEASSALVRILDPDGVQLRMLFKDDDPRVRAGAAYVATLWLYNATPAADAEGLQRIAAQRAETLVSILVPLLADKNPLVRERSLRRLAELAHDEVPMPREPVLARLADRREIGLVRAQAATTLSRMGGDVRADLRPYLRDTDALVRVAAIRAVNATQLDQPDATLEPEFLRLMRDPAATVRAQAAAALSSYSGKPDAPCRAALLAGLHDADEAVRLACALSLHRKGAPAIEAIAHLGRWLGKGSKEERSVAVRLLGSMPEQAAPYEPALVSLLDSADEEARVKTLRALASMAVQDGTLEAALAHTKQKDANSRVAAYEILTQRFSDRAVALAALKIGLDDPSSFVVVPIATDLIRRGIAVADAAKACARLLADAETHFGHRADAIGLLGQCGREARVAIAALIEALDTQLWPGTHDPVGPPWPGGNPVVDVFAALPEFADEFVPALVGRAVRGNAVAVAALVKMEPRAGKQIAAALAKLSSQKRAALQTAMKVRRQAEERAEERGG